MKRLLSSKQASRGQAIVLMAVLMIALLSFAVLAIDGGQFYNQRRNAQNASDMAAMAGIYEYITDFLAAVNNPAIPPVNDPKVLLKIQQLAEANGIADPDGTAEDGSNANVDAWWLDSNGNILAQIANDPGQSPPTGANGVRVRTRIPYRTFIGGLVGHPDLVAQADGTAKIDWSYKPISGVDNTAVWVGGGDCNNLTDRIAHNYSNTNSAKFSGNIYIKGSLAVGSVNGTDFLGDVKVYGPVGHGPIDGAPADSNGNPTCYQDITTNADNNPFDSTYQKFTSGTGVCTTNNNGGGASNKFHGFGFYVNPPSTGMSPWATITLSDGSTHQLDASDFLPPNGEMYKRYLSIYKPLGIAPDNFYHVIPGDPDPSTNTAAAAIDAQYQAGSRGIFYVDGDLTIPNSGSNGQAHGWDGVTLIVNGKFMELDSNRKFYTAGPAARNISVLAGADLGTPANNYSERCASNRANAVFQVSTNNNQFYGITYTPYGQMLFQGNTSGGQAFSGPLITYSLYLGSGSNDCQNNNPNPNCTANSWQFNFDSSLLGDPIPATTLQH